MADSHPGEPDSTSSDIQSSSDSGRECADASNSLSTVEDDKRHLSTDHLASDLGSRSVRGGIVTLVSQHARSVIDIAAMLALARMLEPTHFGLVMTVVVITRFCETIMELGLHTATVQRDEISTDQINTLFWINAMAGAGFAFVMLASAPIIAAIYEQPSIASIAAVMALTLLFNGCAIQHNALLERQMRLNALAIINSAAVISASLMAVVMAAMGCGFWSLVCMHVTFSVVRTTCVWMACRWRPTRPKWSSNVSPLLKFGRHLTGFNLLEYLSRNLDRFLIGWYWKSMAVLGLYTQAIELLFISSKQVCNPLSGVTVPGLSRLQREPRKFREYFLNSLSFVLVVSVPIACVLFTMGYEIISVVLGDKWLGVVPILRYLAICGLFLPILETTKWIFKATGNGRRLLRWGVIASFCTIGSFFIGLPFGVEEVALSYTICTAILTIPGVYVATRGTSVTCRDVGATFVRPLIAGLAATAVTFLVKTKVCIDWPVAQTLALGMVTMIGTYALVLLFGLGMKEQTMQFWQAMRKRQPAV